MGLWKSKNPVPVQRDKVVAKPQQGKSVVENPRKSVTKNKDGSKPNGISKRQFQSDAKIGPSQASVHGEEEKADEVANRKKSVTGKSRNSLLFKRQESLEKQPQKSKTGTEIPDDPIAALGQATPEDKTHSIYAWLEQSEKALKGELPSKQTLRCDLPEDVRSLTQNIYSPDDESSDESDQAVLSRSRRHYLPPKRHAKPVSNKGNASSKLHNSPNNNRASKSPKDAINLNMTIKKKIFRALDQREAANKNLSPPTQRAASAFGKSFQRMPLTGGVAVNFSKDGRRVFQSVSTNKTTPTNFRSRMRPESADIRNNYIHRRQRSDYSNNSRSLYSTSTTHDSEALREPIFSSRSRRLRRRRRLSSTNKRGKTISSNKQRFRRRESDVSNGNMPTKHLNKVRSGERGKKSRTKSKEKSGKASIPEGKKEKEEVTPEPEQVSDDVPETPSLMDLRDVSEVDSELLNQLQLTHEEGDCFLKFLSDTSKEKTLATTNTLESNWSHGDEKSPTNNSTNESTTQIDGNNKREPIILPGFPFWPKSEKSEDWSNQATTSLYRTTNEIDLSSWGNSLRRSAPLTSLVPHLGMHAMNPAENCSKTIALAEKHADITEFLNAHLPVPEMTFPNTQIVMYHEVKPEGKQGKGGGDATKKEAPVAAQNSQTTRASVVGTKGAQPGKRGGRDKKKGKKHKHKNATRIAKKKVEKKKPIAKPGGAAPAAQDSPGATPKDEKADDTLDDHLILPAYDKPPQEKTTGGADKADGAPKSEKTAAPKKVSIARKKTRVFDDDDDFANIRFITTGAIGEHDERDNVVKPKPDRPEKEMDDDGPPGSGGGGGGGGGTAKASVAPQKQEDPYPYDYGGADSSRAANDLSYSYSGDFRSYDGGGGGGGSFSDSVTQDDRSREDSNKAKYDATDFGGICFKLPGRVTHKTTIRVAHFPRTGNEQTCPNPPMPGVICPGCYCPPNPCCPQNPCGPCSSNYPGCCYPPTGKQLNNCNIYNTCRNKVKGFKNNNQQQDEPEQRYSQQDRRYGYGYGYGGY